MSPKEIEDSFFFHKSQSPKDDPENKAAIAFFEEYFRNYFLISSYWKNNLHTQQGDLNKFDRDTFFLKENLPRPALLPASIRQLGFALLSSDFLKNSDTHEVNTSSIGRHQLLYIVSATSDCLTHLFDIFYEFYKRRVLEKIDCGLVIAIPRTQISEILNLCHWPNSVYIIPIDQPANSILNPNSHSFYSSIRFATLSQVLLDDLCDHAVVTDLDLVMPRDFDFAFPNRYGDIRLRFWHDNYPRHWRNAAAGFVYVRNSTRGKLFANSLMKSFITLNKTINIGLCGDQIALECALRFKPQDLITTQFSENLQTYYGSLEKKQEEMMLDFSKEFDRLN